MTDEKYMDLAIEIASKSNFPFGTVIVKNGKIIGRSDAKPPVSQSEFSHSELVAIEDAIEELGGHLCAEGGKEATIYCSCEPCAMCLGAILYTGIGRLVYGARLEDSRECVNEILAKSSDVAAACTNRHIEIVPEVQRQKAVKVMQQWKNNN